MKWKLWNVECYLVDFIKSQSKFIVVCIEDDTISSEYFTSKVWRLTKKILIINAMIFTFILIISNCVLINSIQSFEGRDEKKKFTSCLINCNGILPAAWPLPLFLSFSLTYTQQPLTRNINKNQEAKVWFFIESTNNLIYEINAS